MKIKILAVGVVLITVSLFGRNAQAAVQDHLSSSEISYSIAAMEGRQ